MKAILVSASLLLAACSTNASVIVVDANSYIDLDKCWIRKGSFQAFVVLHIENNKYYPYFISPWCDIQADGYPSGLGFIPYIKALKFSADEGTLLNASLFEERLQSTTPTHTPMPKDSDKVYLYSGSVQVLNNDSFTYYKIFEPKKFIDTNVNLKKLIEEDPDKRLKRFQSVIK